MPSLQTLLTTRILIRIMGGLGGLWLIYILFSASLSNSGPQTISLERAAARVDGFALAFPPRPLPPMPISGTEGVMTLAEIEGQTLIVQFRPVNCGPPCEAPLAALQQHLSEVPPLKAQVITVTLSTQIESAPDIPSFSDPSGQYRDYVGTPPKIIIYQKDRGEIGRDDGTTDWASPQAERFLTRLIGP
ncbi:MAG: hypothetical protein AAF603_06605 [Pseudomonadota bacterium]